MKKPKSKWEVLRKTLEQELKLTKSAKKHSIKIRDYQSVIEFDNQFHTVNWVLQEMEVIEQTGKAL